MSIHMFFFCMTLHVYMKLLLMKQINVYQNVNEFKIYIGYDKVSKYIDEQINIWSRFLFMKKKRPKSRGYSI
jgi:hypothetical protein